MGEPDFITPNAIIDQVCIEWQKGYTHYTPNRGIPELCDAIALYHANDIQPDPEKQILITCGATEALQLALLAIVDPGDEVIVITPAWPNYFGQIAVCGGIVKVVPALEENEFNVDPQDIRKAVTKKTKAIIFNSPSNPTGAVMSRERCNELAQVILENDIYVIADEVYSKYIYDSDHTSITSFADIKEKTIYINSFSKMFAMTGWRVGYTIASPALIRVMTKLHENFASCLPKPSQLAAAYAIQNCMADVENMRSIYLTRRDLLCSLVNNIKGLSCKVPKGAFYLFVNAAEVTNDSKKFCMDLLKKSGVVTVPGIGFGTAGEGYFRMTYTNSIENIKEGMRRIKAFVDVLNY